MAMLAWLAASCGLATIGWLFAAAVRGGPAMRLLSAFAVAAAGFFCAAVISYPDVCSDDDGWCAVLVIALIVTASGFVLPASAVWLLLERVASHRTVDGSAP